VSATAWRWVISAIAGSTLCTALDHLHATYGVLYYPVPVVWAQAWWVPLLFFSATLATLNGAGAAKRLFDGESLDATSRQIAGSGIAFTSAYAFTSFGHAQPNVVLVVLVAWWVARVVAHAPLWLIAFSLINAVLGTCFEAALSSTGAFYYQHPDFMGVPRWLPGIYLHAALFAAPVYEAIAPRIATAESVTVRT
jgi:hypothetical protein